MNTILEKQLQHEIDPAFARRARWIFENVQKTKPQTVLDAGCGRGFYTKALTTFPFIKRIESFDINSNYLEETKLIIDDARVHLKQASIYNLPYKDSSIDMVILSEVLEHLDKEEVALMELKRVLKPRGLILITVPHHDFPFSWDPINWLLMRIAGTHIPKDIWWLAGIWADHERLYNVSDLDLLAKKTKYSVHEVSRSLHYCWPLSHFMLYAVGKNIVERLNGKAFSRFQFGVDRPLVRLLSRFMALPSSLLDTRLPRNASQNILIALQKNE